MSERLIQVSTLTEIADAIRDKKGTVNPIPVSSYASEIATIETGGGQSDKPFNLVSYFNGTLTEVDDVNGVIEMIGNVGLGSHLYSKRGGIIAFENQSMLERVNLPNCKTISYSQAFANCANLSEISMSTCSSINGSSVFENCTSLVDVTFEGVEYVNMPSGFYKCTNLKTVTFTNCESLYGTSMFQECYNLESVYLPNCLEIGASIFHYRYLSSSKYKDFDVYAPRKYLSIGGGSNFITTNYYQRSVYLGKLNGNSLEVLMKCGASYVDLPSLCKIMAKAELNGISRTQYIIGRGVQWVCPNFAGSYSLSSLYRLDLSICESIGANAFSYAPVLSNLLLPNCWYIGNAAFQYSPLISDISSIPVEYVGSSAFRASPISSANWSLMTYIGQDAFSAAAKILTGLPSELSNCSYLAGFTYNSWTTASNSYAKVICFSQCRSLVSVDFPACEEVLSSAFYSCYLLESIYLPNCKKVGSFAFIRCSALSIVDLPLCESIGAQIFNYASSMVTVNMPNLLEVPYYTFGGCSQLTSVNIEACKAIRTNAFSKCSQLTELNLPNCELIEDGVFGSCSALSLLSVPKLKYISYGSSNVAPFNGCSALTSLDFPELITVQGNYLGVLANISTISFGNLEDMIRMSGYKNLYSVYLNASYVIPMTAGVYNVFFGTPIYSSVSGVWGSIYVYASLYEEYKTATNWAQISSRFVSM